MKNILFSLATLFTINASAGVITCSNNANSPGQYTSLQVAIDNANANDTILVHGSPTSYGSITLNSKALTLIGAGINKPSTEMSQTGGISFNRLSNSLSGSGCKLIGLKICVIDFNPSFTGGTQSTQIIENVTIERCLIDGVAGCSSTYYQGLTLHYLNHQYNNILVKNCIWTGTPFRMANFPNMGFTMTNFVFENNIFQGAGFWYMPAIEDLSSLIFKNNFFGNGCAQWNYQGNPATIVNGPYFSNNIFFGSNGGGLTNATFNNNLTYSCVDDDLFNSNTNCTGGGNIFGQDPMLVNYPITGSNFNYTLDYHLSSSSPAIGTGVAGVDIGVFGGPSSISEVGANPAIPQLEEITTPLGSDVSKGTNLNVTFKSYKQD